MDQFSWQMIKFFFFIYIFEKEFVFSYRLYTWERLNNRSAETGKHQVHNKEIQLSKENLEFLKSYSYSALTDLNSCLSFNRRARNLQSVTLKLCKGLAFNLKRYLTCLKNYVKYSSSNGNKTLSGKEIISLKTKYCSCDNQKGIYLQYLRMSQLF